MSDAMAFSPAWLSFAEASARFLLFNWFAQATCWLAAGLLVSRLPRLRPATRHALLLASLVAATAAPIALVLPSRLGMPVRRIAAEPQRESGRLLSPLTLTKSSAPDLREAGGSASAATQLFPAPTHLGLILVAAWLFLALVRLGRLGAGSWLVTRWGRGAVPVDRSLLFDACRYHVADIPVLEADGVQVPTVVGVFQPRILLPRGMAAALTPEKLGHVLLHEEAHVRRRDPLWLLIAELAHALLCWHPLAEWCRRSLARAAEDACDARVLGHGAKETSYARTLLTVLERSAPVTRLGVTCPLGSAGAELRRRVGQILQGTQPASRVMAGIAAGVVAGSGAAATTVQFGVRPALPPPTRAVPRMTLSVTPAVRVPRTEVQRAPIVVLGGKPLDARRHLSSRPLPSVEPALTSEPELADLKVSSPREGRTLVFLLDNSSSMRPFQAEARADILAYLDQLAPGDRFNVIAFASDVSQFAAVPVMPSEETLAGVRAWIGALPEAHGSNLAAGMVQALATPELTSLVIYSDGKATGSVTDPSSLGQLVARENSSHAQVLSVAFGAAMDERAEFIPGVAPAPVMVPSIQAGQRPDDDLRP